MTRILVLVIAAVLTSGCADAGGPRDQTTTPTQGQGAAPSGQQRWLAVIEVAPLADDLSAATQRLRDPLGLALVVSPVGCFEGLPLELETGYLIGAVGESATEVEQLISKAGERVLFTSPVAILCTD